MLHCLLCYPLVTARLLLESFAQPPCVLVSYLCRKGPLAGKLKHNALALRECCAANQDGSLHGGASFRGVSSAPLTPELPGPLLTLDSDEERPFAGMPASQHALPSFNSCHHFPNREHYKDHVPDGTAAPYLHP